MTSDRTSHLEFQHTIEGLFVNALGADMSPELKDKLRKAGLDLSKPLEPAYPSMKYMEWLRITALHLTPGLPVSEGVRTLGRRFLRGYGETFLGKTVFKVMRLIGVRRSLDRIARSFRTGDNYSDATLNWIDKSEVHITFNEVHDLPTYNQGILEQILIEMRAEEYGVEVLSCPSGVEAVYRVTWKDV